MESVGAYGAKTHLPRLLDAVAEVIGDLHEARRGVTLGDLSLADLISEGRR